jgi:hypothetical protein
VNVYQIAKLSLAQVPSDRSANASRRASQYHPSFRSQSVARMTECCGSCAQGRISTKLSCCEMQEWMNGEIEAFQPDKRSSEVPGEPILLSPAFTKMFDVL